MEVDRRGLLALAPAWLLSARAMAQTSSAPLPPGVPDQAAFQAQLAPFWGRLAALPSIRSPALEAPTAGICYMFTNKDCQVCQLVHKEYPKGYRRLEMRYIIYPWPGEPWTELNYLYRPGASLAEYEAYMAHRLKAVALSESSAQGERIMAVAADIAHRLIEGDAFGTPFFVHAVPDDRNGHLRFSAGDVVAMASLLDGAA